MRPAYPTRSVTVTFALAMENEGRVLSFAARASERGLVLEPWVRKQQVAEHFGVSERTLERWRAEGMPCRRLSSTLIRYRLSECEEWLSARPAG